MPHLEDRNWKSFSVGGGQVVGRHGPAHHQECCLDVCRGCVHCLVSPV